jgi:hypothetical protein
MSGILRVLLERNFKSVLVEKFYGNFEKSLSLPIADSLGVNVNESERKRNGIIRGQFCGVRRAGPIFRGALMIFLR